MDLLVVGAGEMGRWFAQYCGATSITYTDVNFETARAAAERHQTRAISIDTQERFDVVCIAVPIIEVPSAISSHAEQAQKAIIDVSGEMQNAVNALQIHAADIERASFHPLFSAQNAPGNIPVVIDNEGPSITAIIESLEAAGNTVFSTSIQEHDQAMKTVQARTHAAILSFALAADPVDDRFHTTISKPLQKLVDDVTGNNPAVYAAIQERFDGAEDIAHFANQLASADSDTFEELYSKASQSSK